MGGTWWNLVSFEQIRAMDEAEVTRRANEHLGFNRGGLMPNVIMQPADFVAAQFYVNELDRRQRQRDNAERDKIDRDRWQLDVVLELLIVALILIEIGIAIYGGVEQSKTTAEELSAFREMKTAMLNLQKSSEATATSLGSVTDILGKMRVSLQKQVELYYDVQTNVMYNEASKRLLFINSGRTSIFIWAHRVGEGTGAIPMYTKAVAISPGNTYEMPVEEFMKNLASIVPKDQQKMLKFTFLIKNEKQEPFTVGGDLIAAWRGDTLVLNSHPDEIIPGWKK